MNKFLTLQLPTVKGNEPIHWCQAFFNKNFWSLSQVMFSIIWFSKFLFISENFIAIFPAHIFDSYIYVGHHGNNSVLLIVIMNGIRYSTNYNVISSFILSQIVLLCLNFNSFCLQLVTLLSQILIFFLQTFDYCVF